MRIEVALRRPACQDSVSGQHLAGPYYMVHGSRRGARASAVFGGLFALHQGGLLERNQPLSFHFTSSLHANCRAQTPKFLKHVTVAGFFESAVAVPFSNSSSSLPKPGLQPKRERDPNVVCFTAAATGERKPSVRKLVHFHIVPSCPVSRRTVLNTNFAPPTEGSSHRAVRYVCQKIAIDDAAA